MRVACVSPVSVVAGCGRGGRGGRCTGVVLENVPRFSTFATELLTELAARLALARRDHLPAALGHHECRTSTRRQRSVGSSVVLAVQYNVADDLARGLARAQPALWP